MVRGGGTVVRRRVVGDRQIFFVRVGRHLASFRSRWEDKVTGEARFRLPRAGDSTRVRNVCIGWEKGGRKGGGRTSKPIRSRTSGSGRTPVVVGYLIFGYEVDQIKACFGRKKEMKKKEEGREKIFLSLPAMCSDSAGRRSGSSSCLVSFVSVRVNEMKFEASVSCDLPLSGWDESVYVNQVCRFRDGP